MSYVHDMRLDPDYDREAFTGAVPDIRTLFGRSEVPVVGPSGRPGTQPILEGGFIGFNGINHNCTCDPGDPDYHALRRCSFITCGPFQVNNDGAQPFMVGMSPDRRHGHPLSRGRYWSDCKTHGRPYDLAVMLAMIPLKHQLGDRIELRTKGTWWTWQHGSWLFPPGPGWGSSSAVELYEHVFPERAPVQNILSREGP